MSLGPGMNAPGFGVEPDDKEVDVIATKQVCAGYVYPFAFLQSSKITTAVSAGGLGYATSVNSPGASNSPWAVILGGASAIAALDLRCGRFCVAIKDIPLGGTGKVKVKGLVKAYCVYTTPSGSSVNITPGSELTVKASGFANGHGVLDATPANSLTLATSVTSPRKYVGMALDTVACATASAADTLILVDFDGWDGIGSAGNV